MNRDTSAGAFLMGIFIGMIPALFIGGFVADTIIRKQAVMHHAAYYKTDVKSGSCYFTWGQPNVNERTSEQTD